MKKNAVWALILVLISVAGANASARPNFIFVFADDLGWGDLGCYGHQEIKTPNLDKMAKEGLRLTNFYVNAPTCSPSRAAVMTSHFPSRHRIHWAIHGDPQINARRNMPNHLDPKLHMVTRLLQTGGYTTGHFGKWHLSGLSPKPKDYGIDVSKTKGLSTPTHAQSTENIINETIKFVEANRDKPFYVNTLVV